MQTGNGASSQLKISADVLGFQQIVINKLDC